MRLKKGFTLAEILIVLMVIGVVATMTIPSLMRGVQDAQFKTAYKKAFNAVVNIAAMESISGNFVANQSDASVTAVYNALKTNLSVKDFGPAPTQQTVSNGVAVALTDITDAEPTAAATAGTSYWLTTEDNISYTVMTMRNFKAWSGDSPINCTGDACPTKGDDDFGCGTKSEINARGIDEACVVVVVDVNGISGTPNIFDPQVKTHPTTTSNLSQLKGDRFPIYIGTDGATAGSKKFTVTGRMIAELK